MTNVKLLSHTEDPLQVIWTAARTCTTNILPSDLWDDWVESERFDKLFEKLYFSGHHSVFEHVSFTFAIEGISRVASHQLVRKRIGASYSQQSLRYVKAEGFEVPNDVYTVALDCFEIYEDLLEKGYKRESARSILPMGTTSNMVVTLNLRSLIDLAGERGCLLAQDEIRLIVNQMRRLISAVYTPFGNAMAIKCQRLGYCNEFKNADGKCTIRPYFDTTKLKKLKLI